jgi:Ferric uptake regulator family
VGSEAPAALRSPAAEVIEGVLAVLRDHGSRITQARLLLAALVRPGHHSAENIAAAVREQAPAVHLTTIYRNLDELERLRAGCPERGAGGGSRPGAGVAGLVVVPGRGRAWRGW